MSISVSGIESIDLLNTIKMRRPSVYGNVTDLSFFYDITRQMQRTIVIKYQFKN